MKRRRVVFLTLIALIGLGSSGCVLKYSYNELEDPWFDSRVNHGGFIPPLEAAAMTDNVPVGGFSAFALSFEMGGQSLDLDAVPPLVDFERVSIGYFSFGARFFPVDRGPIRPYAGAGYGRSRLTGRWSGPNYDVTRYDCIGACEGTYTEVFWNGWHPHLIGGVELRSRQESSASILLEYRKDVSRGDDFYELDGTRLSAGIRWIPGL